MINKVLLIIMLFSSIVLANENKSSLSKSSTIIDDINRSFERIKEIKFMKQKVYELSLNGKMERGNKEFFLRKRKAEEIIKTNLSSGCGDYAFVFYYLMNKIGYKTLLVEGVKISNTSFINPSSGHMVVAVKKRNSSTWLLIDPATKKIISDSWKLDEKIFLGKYWIGFIGEKDKYLVKNFEDLKRFYQKTLSSIPTSVLNEKIIGLKFSIDPLYKEDFGNHLDKRISEFISEVSNIYTKNKILPKKWYNITFVKGKDNDKSKLSFTDKNNFIALVGRKSRLSSSFLHYVETFIIKKIEEEN